MSDKRKGEVRNAVLGADRAFKVIDGGGGAGSGVPPEGAGGRPDDDCPIVALGDNDGAYYFLDPIGQRRQFSARDLGGRPGLVSLFRGDETWLRKRFPKEKEVDDGTGNKVIRVIDFHINAAARFLIQAASQRGILGTRVQFRKPGIWRADDGQPVVHCGDRVLIDGDWMIAGTDLRTGHQVWAAAEATPRPAAPCDASVGRELQRSIQHHWRFRETSGAIALLGLLVSGYLCGALDWRINAFITGLSGSGKTALRKVIRNAWPLHGYTNDTTKSGIEQAISGSAMPTVIDETNDRRNPDAGRDLLDMVLGASGDEGTRGLRGTTDGKGRSVEVITAVIMFSIDSPELLPQHKNRFTLLELLKPEDGADFRQEHADLARQVERHAPALWGRAISSFERYQECLRLFRAALRDRRVDPREMDGKSAMLAGWFILTHEGLPGDMQLREGVAAIGELIVSSDQASLDDAPRRCLQHLLGSLAFLHRTTDRDPIGTLLDVAFGENHERQPASAADSLANYGLRPVRHCNVPPEKRDLTRHCECPACFDRAAGKRVPRGGPEDGLWVSNANSELAKLFNGTDFDGGRWRQQMMRMPSARASRKNVRIGGQSRGAIWLSRSDLHVNIADETFDGEPDVR